jgi:hypothetical protein
MGVSHRWTHSPGVLWAYNFETTDGYQVLYSLRYKQFWSAVLDPLFRIDDVRASQHVFWGNMVFLWHPNDDEMNLPLCDYYNLNLLSLTNTRYVIAAQPLDDPNLELLPSEKRDDFERWDDRHTTARAMGAMRGEWAYRPLYIYENRKCLPRFFLAPHVEIYDRASTLVYDLRSRDVDWLRQTVAVCRDDLPEGVNLEALEDNSLLPCQESIGDVTVVSRTSDRLELEFHADQQCVLFLSNTWHPGWKAELDGQSTPVFAANHAFQGIHIFDAGKHRVVLTYHAAYSLAN